MSKKGLEKFYNEVLPTLKAQNKFFTNYGSVMFDDYPTVYIKKQNGDIVEEYLFDIEGLSCEAPFDNDTLKRLLNPWKTPVIHMLSGTYRWADGYGRTWALTKAELI